MAQIDVSRTHHLGQERALSAAERVLEELRHEHGLHLDTLWEGDILHARGRGFEAFLEAGSEHIRVQVRLGLFLLPMRGMIRREVNEYLDRYFNGNEE